MTFEPIKANNHDPYMPNNSNHVHTNKHNKLSHSHKPSNDQVSEQTYQQAPQPNQQSQQSKEYLSGTIERITYHNSDNGFCVLRVKAKSHKDLVTVTGNVPMPCVGEYIKCSGVWINDRNYGLQFKADFLKSMPPDSLEGIEKYLGSGLIKGIGAHFAKKLVARFKEEVFDVIENSPNKLREVENIGAKRTASICSNWKEQKIVREIMVFLQSHGVGTTRATRIYKTYGAKAIEIVSQNPYQLAKDIRGIGFVSADTIAGNLGIAKDSMIRARAGLSHVLLEATSEGHCALPESLLLQNMKKLLDIEEPLAREAIEAELVAGTITRDLIEDNITDVSANANDDRTRTTAIFLTSYYIYEKSIAQMLKKLSASDPSWNKEDVDHTSAVHWFENQDGEGGGLAIKLAEFQKLALFEAIQTKVMVITGGPGTGKTTLVNAILNVLSNESLFKQKLNIKLCAPTGRAAKRLSESTGKQAVTIHRLLETDHMTGKFKRGKDLKLEADYLVIDETSMVDVQLFHSLLQALPETTGLLIVGDVDQLPSVGAGRVLSDIIDSGNIKTIKLTEIFRQAADSNIIKSAHLVNKGQMPYLEYRDYRNKSSSKDALDQHSSLPVSSSASTSSPNPILAPTSPLDSTCTTTPTQDSDFYFIEAEQGTDVLNKIIRLVKERIPQKFKFDPLNDIQILCPMQRGGNGARSLNIELQKVLNPDYESGITKYGQTFAVKDKVMQIQNNYDKEVYNGDIGIIESINTIEQEITIRFDDREVIYDYSDLDQITLSYAITIHKSQGSEYLAVIIPITMQSFMMLKRNLIYTAITRGKKLVVMIGERKALAIAVRNNKTLGRYSKLREWLVG